MSDAMIAVVCLLVGLVAGWLVAHDEVAMECKRQGSFYVGRSDFTCHLKEGR